MARVVATKHETRCVVCASGRAEDVNVWLGRLADGEASWADVEKAAEVLLAKSVSQSALKRHRAKHCQVLEDGQVTEREQAQERDRESVTDLFNRVLGENWEQSVPSPEAVLELQRALWARETYKDALEGRSIKVTHDQVVRGIDATTKRKANEETSILLRGIGAAAGGFAARLLEKEPAAELVEGEVIAEEDV